VGVGAPSRRKPLGANRRKLGIWGKIPHPPEARGSGDGIPSAERFCNFSIKITNAFYAYFGQNGSFKSITHQ